MKVEKNIRIVNGINGTCVEKVVLGYYSKPRLDNTYLLKEVFSEYADKPVFTNWVAAVDKDTTVDTLTKKPRKIPFMGYKMKCASSNNPKTWVDLTECANVLDEMYKLQGIMIMLGVSGVNYTVIDVDHIKKNGNPEDITEGVSDLEITKYLVNKFGSYAEISTSGQGFHIFLRGKVEIPEGYESGKNGRFEYAGYTADFELFDGENFNGSNTGNSNRAICLTGNIIDPELTTIKDINKDEFIDFVKATGNIVKEQPKAKIEYKQFNDVVSVTRDDEAIINMINSSWLKKYYNPDKILFTKCAENTLGVVLTESGYDTMDIEQFKDEYDNNPNVIKKESPSEYDALFIGLMAKATHNVEQLKRLFKSSPYYTNFRGVRDKKKFKTDYYLDMTINRAIEYSNKHPEINPFEYEDVNYLTNNLHNNRLTDKVFGEYLYNKGILNDVKCLADTKAKAFIGYDYTLGCWNLTDKDDGIVINKINTEIDRLIAIIEKKRAADYEALQKKIAAVEAAGNKWEGARDLPKDPVYSYLVSLQNINGITDLLKYIKSSLDIKTRQGDFDTAADTGRYLNFIDCKLNLDTGEFEEHSAKDLIAVRVDIRVKDYLNPDGSIKHTGTVMKFIKDFFTPTYGDDTDVLNKELYWYFITALGAILYGSNKEKAFFILKGQSHTGKSVLIDSLHHILSGSNNYGEQGYTTKASTSFLSKPEGGNDEEMYKLRGKRALFISEAKADAVFDAPRIKNISGSATLTAQKKYESLIEFDNMIYIVLDTNEIPTAKNCGDIAFFNRLKIIECKHVVNPKDMDKDLRSKLIEDKGGWLLLFKLASDKYRTEGLNDVNAVTDAVEEYKEDKFRIINFCNHYLEFTKEASDFISASDGFEAFKEFLKNEYGDETAVGNENAFITQVRNAYADKLLPRKQGRYNGKVVRGMFGVRFKSVEPRSDEDEIGWNNSNQDLDDLF